MKVFFTDKNIENWIKENPTEAQRIIEKHYPTPITKVEEEKKPTTRRAIMEVLLVNNSTDKTHSIVSENDFGLNWDWIRDKDNRANYELLCVNQNHSLRKDGEDKGWTAVGRFTGFSVLKSTWKTFDINEGSENIEVTNVK
jgi:hypothetical protein